MSRPLMPLLAFFSGSLCNLLCYVDSTGFLDNLVDLVDNNTSFIASMMFNAVSSLPLEPGMRASIGEVMHRYRTEEIVYVSCVP